MNLDRLGFWSLLAYLLVDFGQVHRMIPGMEFLYPGLITQAALLLLVASRFFTFRWLHPIALWRALFLLSFFPGLLWGVTEGRVAMILEAEVPRLLTGFLGACLFLRRAEDLRTLHRLLLALSLLISVWVVTHGGHGPGLYVDENDAALVLIMLLPFAYLAFVGAPRPGHAALAGLVFFTSLLAIGVTLSRGGMVGALLVLLLCWLRGERKAIGLAGGAALLAAAVALAPERLAAEFRTIAQTEEGTAADRFYFWELSLELFRERPLFGVGADCWNNALYSGLIARPHGTGVETPHSIYFQLVSELGVAGTAAWLGLLAGVGLTLYRLRLGMLRRQMTAVLSTAAAEPAMLLRLRDNSRFLHRFGLALGIGIAGYLISGAFLSVLYYPAFYFFAAFVQAAHQSWNNDLALASAAGEA